MFRGNYKLKNSNGTNINYSNGDVILYQGKVYQCLNSTAKSPLQQPKNWKYTGNTEQFISENPPLNPKLGQIWIKDGTSYVWYEDKNSSQWVET
jgi:hypothetical protein